MIYSNFYCLGSSVFLITTIIFALLTTAFLLRTAHLTKYISELKKEKEKILTDLNKDSKNPLGRLFSANAKSLSLSLGKDGKIIQISDSLLNTLGYTKKQLVGKNIYDTLMDLPKPNKFVKIETNLINRLFSNPKLYREHETEFKKKNGEKIWISWTNNVLFNKSGKAQEVHSVGFDITERKKMEQQLQFLATIDPQTGILNRQSLLETGTKELKRTLRHKHDFSALAFQLFIPDNSDLTETQKDTLLNQFVSVFKKAVRDTDYFGRISEDEYVILLPETPLQSIPALKERLLQKLEDYKKKNPKSPVIEVFFGFSGYQEKMKSIDALITDALKKIKRKG